jgi:hypothetical protein
MQLHFVGNVHRSTLTKRSLLHLVAQLEATSGDYLTICVRPSSCAHYATQPKLELGAFAGEITMALSNEAVLREAQRYGTGAVIFWSESGNRLIILPAFDVPEDTVLRGKPETSLLSQLLKKDRILGIVLVTWGSYAVGVFKSDRLVESKTGTGYIHKRH